MTAAASIGVSTLAITPAGVEPGVQDDPGMDFTAALAEAVAPAVATCADATVQVAADTAPPSVPDGTQSDAALAWMAAMLNEIRLPEPPAPLIEGADTALAAAVADGAQFAASSAAPAVAVKPSGANAATAAKSQPLADLAAGTTDSDAAAVDSMAIVTRMLASFPERAPAHAAAAVEFDPLQPASGNALYTQTREALVAPAAAQTTFSDTLRSAVGSPRWSDELGSRLVMMSTRGQQEGSLSLSPEHLGPLEVRISMSQDGTNVWFGAQHADTRAALTDALPRLREMFAASGLALGQAGVSQEMPRQEARRSEFAGGVAGASDPDAAVQATPAARRVRSALLDTWA